MYVLEYFNWDKRDIVTGFKTKEDKKSMTVIIRKRKPRVKKDNMGTKPADIHQPNQYTC
jgi:hypothetical protein